MWVAIRRYFFNGLIILLPLFITVYILWFMFSFADGIFSGLVELAIGRKIPGLGFLVTIGLIFVIGYIGTYVIGKKLIQFGEFILSKLPIVKSIYSSVKQVNDVLFIGRGEKTFRRACVVEYPRKGIYTVGFVTTEAAEEILTKTKENLVSIFIPNTPTPATGFLIQVPVKEVQLLDMRLDDAFKLVVSGGVLKPPYKAQG